jgi:hypothetical protein
MFKNPGLLREFCELMALLMAIGFIVKGHFEPAGWFYLSTWAPWLVFGCIEALLISWAATFNYLDQKSKEVKDYEKHSLVKK